LVDVCLVFDMITLAVYFNTNFHNLGNISYINYFGIWHEQSRNCGSQPAAETENMRASSELDIIPEIKHLILPQSAEFAAIQNLEIAGFMELVDEVGGDYYDLFYFKAIIKVGYV